ncbi:MAG: broad specificity phosphatase PhoE [Gammaproteobacteria bacterium]|jgi:broad specificity phosphatase PhoE
MTSRIQLIRHGQVHSDWRSRIYGCLDVPLSKHGEAEARRAAEFLRAEQIDQVFSTGLSRSAYGAQLIASSRDLSVQTEPELREIERGAWAKLTYEELERLFPGAFESWNLSPWDQKPKGGESLDELLERVTKSLVRIAKQYPEQTVAIVAHRHVLRCALACALGKDESLQRIIPTGTVLTLDWPESGQPELISAECFESEDN